MISNYALSRIIAILNITFGKIVFICKAEHVCSTGVQVAFPIASSGCLQDRVKSCLLSKDNREVYVNSRLYQLRGHNTDDLIFVIFKGGLDLCYGLTYVSRTHHLGKMQSDTFLWETLVEFFRIISSVYNTKHPLCRVSIPATSS